MNTNKYKQIKTNNGGYITMKNLSGAPYILLKGQDLDLL